MTLHVVAPLTGAVTAGMMETERETNVGHYDVEQMNANGSFGKTGSVKAIIVSLKRSMNT